MRDPPRLRLGDDGMARALEAERHSTLGLFALTQQRVLHALAAEAWPATLSLTSRWALGALFAAGVVVGGGGVGAVMAARAPQAPAPTIVSTPPPRAPVVPLQAAPLPAPAQPAAPKPAASLHDELRQLERAQGALEGGRVAIAVHEFRTLLERFPRGRLRTEATDGLLRALLAAGRPEEALDVLQREGQLLSATERRAFRVRAHLARGACDDARHAAEDDATLLSAVKAHCALGKRNP